ncbi:hypothetical protein BMS3Bbin04_00278 [bacterium BMS3Bbin04]|nr:hypothetical protein BMS3Bbin04_00278 [bacterium BMS3Bbin04]
MNGFLVADQVCFVVAEQKRHTESFCLSHGERELSRGEEHSEIDAFKLFISRRCQVTEYFPILFFINQLVVVYRKNEKCGETNLIRFIFVEGVKIWFAFGGFSVAFAFIRRNVARVFGANSITPDIIVEWFRFVPDSVTVNVEVAVPITVVINAIGSGFVNQSVFVVVNAIC